MRQSSQHYEWNEDVMAEPKDCIRLQPDRPLLALAHVEMNASSLLFWMQLLADLPRMVVAQSLCENSLMLPEDLDYHKMPVGVVVNNVWMQCQFALPLFTRHGVLKKVLLEAYEYDLTQLPELLRTLHIMPASLKEHEQMHGTVYVLAEPPKQYGLPMCTQAVVVRQVGHPTSTEALEAMCMLASVGLDGTG